MSQQNLNQQQPQTGNQVHSVQLAKSGMAIAGFVLGIIALLTSFVPFVNNISFFLAILGIIFTIIGFVGIARGKKTGKGFAIAALVICVVSCAVVLATQNAYSEALTSASSATTVSSSSEGTASSDASAAATETQKSDFTVADEKLNIDTYSATITGTVTNTTDQDKSYVGVTYNLYDKDGNMIGNAYDGADTLKAGASWKFEAYADVSNPKDIASFERGDMTSW